MKLLLIPALLSLLSITLNAQGVSRVQARGTPMKSELARQSDTLVDSIGFATHLSYDDTNYVRSFSKMKTLMQNMGLRHIRDGVSSKWKRDAFQVANYRALGSIGIDLTLIADPASSVSSLTKFAGWVGNVTAWEGMNECDVNNCITSGVELLPTLRRSADALGISVVGMSMTTDKGYSMTGDIKPYVNYNNLHVYFGGRNPGNLGWGGLNTPSGDGYATTRWWMYTSNRNCFECPSIVTEVGYPAARNPTPYTTTEDVQGKYLTRLLLSNFAWGVKRSFVYEFLDEGTTSGEKTYGVVRSDMTPKPAYTAISNLIALVSDKGKPFIPMKLTYRLTDGDDSLRHVILQKRDGTFLLILWLEQSSMDPTNNNLIAVKPLTVTLAVPSAKAIQLNQFSPAGVVSRSALSLQALMPITVSDSITILRIGQ